MEGVVIATTDQEAAQQGAMDDYDADEAKVAQLYLQLAKKKDPKLKRLNQIEFEKDDDNNKHMDFMTSCSNLRADNYQIEGADKMKTKQIAGKIIPAIATTTAATAGLVGLELYKVIMSRHKNKCPPIELFKDSFMNLALTMFTSADPNKAPVKKYGETEWTAYDCFEVQGDMKLCKLFEHMEKNHNLRITMLSQGVSMLYSFFISAAKREEKMNMNITELTEKVTGRRIPDHVKALVLEPMCEYVNPPEGEEEGADPEVPYIKFILPDRQ